MRGGTGSRDFLPVKLRIEVVGHPSARCNGAARVPLRPGHPPHRTAQAGRGCATRVRAIHLEGRAGRLPAGRSVALRGHPPGLGTV